MNETAREVAQLVLPAVRWHPERGFHDAWPEIERALAAGIRGFILFGGEARSVGDLTQEMRRLVSEPLLFASDLERGAGQQFRGATPLPPAAALGWLNDLEVTRRAGEITAREARAVGVGWVLAPVADLDIEPRNPIVATRAWQREPISAARQVEAWVRGCAEGGALSCLKHFPGGGRATGDSHAELPVIHADREELEQDLLPFRAGIAAGADSVMVGHFAYSALDPSGKPASRSAAIVNRLLRRTLHFDGMVATDAINMAGFQEPGAEDGESAAVEAVLAGCDALLYPDDVEATIAALAEALRGGVLRRERVREATQRLGRAAARVGSPLGAAPGRREDLRWAYEVAIRTIHVVRGAPRLSGPRAHLVEIDDDQGGPHPPPSRAALKQALGDGGVELVEGAPILLALYADVRAWKGRAGLSAAAIARAGEVLASSPEAVVVLFGHPRLVEELPAARNVAVAWGGEPLMQRAAAAWLLAQGEAG